MTTATKCGNCYGTGVRFDVTCYGNVNTHTQAASPCQPCNGTGIEQPKVPSTHKAMHADEVGTGEIPDWML